MSTGDKESGPPLLVCMVGLPARGKSYISRKIQQYFNWVSIKTKIYNLGEYRRKMVEYSDHSFFEHDNAAGKAIRDACLENALGDIKEWFQGGEGKIAIVDATNTALERRNYLCDHAARHRYDIFFVESFCDCSDIITDTIVQVKTKSPDYAGKSADTIVSDFRERIKNYEMQYTPLDAEGDPTLSFVKIINAGKLIKISNLDTPLKNRIARFLLTIRLPPQTVYISRHGESIYNVEHRVGGDPMLSPQGREYAKALGEFINALQIPDLKVWTSTLKRTIETARLIKAPQERREALNEVQVGMCNGMTYEEIKEKWPAMVEERVNDKLKFRYPGGESYEDLIRRLEPIILELEQQKVICIVAHRAIIRGLLSYFVGCPSQDYPNLYVPHHTLFKVTTTSSGCEFEHITFPIPTSE